MASHRSQSVSRSASEESTRSVSASSQPTQDEVSRLDILDCHSIFEVVDYVRQKAAPAEPSAPPPNFDYRACFDIIRDARPQHGFEPSQGSLALATVDPDSEGQARFLSAISRFALVEPVDFREASVTLPPLESDRFERRYVRSLAPHITYVVGLLAGRKSPEVVVVTRAFELFGPLRDFVERRGGKAAVAFFRRLLDPRFGQAGLFDTDSSVKFIDLDTYSERLIGCDLRQLGPGPRPKSQGLAAL